MPWEKEKGKPQITLKKGRGVTFEHVAHLPHGREKGAHLGQKVERERDLLVGKREREREGGRRGRPFDGPPSS